jgi:hypothetical protein
MPITLQPNPAMADLVSADRAQQNTTLAALASANAGYFASLVGAASGAIRAECHREFTVSSYCEYHGGVPNQRVLRLRQFPVVAITRVATAAAALQVYNSGASAQRATAATTATGMTLLTVSSGVSAATVLPYTTYPTLAALAAAVAALGAGWSAQTLSGAYGSFALWPCADLKVTQGAVTALAGGASLEIYEDYRAGGWPVDGWPDAEGSASPGAWRLDSDTGELFGHWPRGQLNIRVDYSAGFATVPDAVQEACVQLAADLYGQSQLNGAVDSARVGSAAYTLNKSARALTRSPKIFGLIAPYVAHDRVIAR